MYPLKTTHVDVTEVHRNLFTVIVIFIIIIIIIFSFIIFQGL
jgi:hypothetical protein